MELALNYLKNLYSFLVTTWNQRELILTLVKSDFKNRYLGSFFGIIWAFVTPAVTILLLWFVFTFGLRAGSVQEYPFVLWLLGGYLSFFYFSEALSAATNSIMEYNYLVKKVVFKVSILPIVKILSALIVHLFFIALILVAAFFYGYGFSIYNLQLIYYLFAMIVLLLGLSWLTSSMVVFIKDMGQIVAIGLQLMFWATPIIWHPQILPKSLKILLSLNPLYYIAEGYRDSYLNQVWFWEHPYLTLYFWSLTGFIFILGGVIFSKLRPHFADVM